MVVTVTGGRVTMTTDPPMRMKVCQFDTSFGLTQYYVCFRNETCCRDGCCAPRNIGYLNTWYFWLGIITVFVVYRIICWYCKKVENDCQTQQQHFARARDIRNLLLRDNQLRQNDVTLNQLDVVTVSTTTSSGDCSAATKSVDAPPDYGEALGLPKPLRCHRDLRQQQQQQQPLPTYEEATSSVNNHRI